MRYRRERYRRRGEILNITVDIAAQLQEVRKQRESQWRESGYVEYLFISLFFIMFFIYSTNHLFLFFSFFSR